MPIQPKRSSGSLPGVLIARLLCTTCIVAVVGTASAATLTVSNVNNAGSGSLRQTIQVASSGDTIVFATNLSGQIIVLTSGEIVLSNNVSIDGSTLTSGIRLGGSGASRIFSILNGVTATLKSLTLTNGLGDAASGGGAILNAGGLTLDRCTLAGNAAGAGGAIANSGSLTVNQCTFAGNFATNSVIAAWTFETATPTATPGANVWITNLIAEVGSGTASAKHVGNATYSTPAGNGSAKSFSANTWAVGDFFQFAVSTVGRSNLVVAFDQTSSGTGPRDFNLQYSTDGSTFTNFGGSYTVLGNGTAPNPGWNSTTNSAAYAYTFDLSGVTALNNAPTVYFRLTDASAVSASGGAVAAGGTDRVDNFSVASGGTGSGGAIFNSGTLLVNQSTLSLNTASTSGGGIRQFAGTASITNAIVAGNSAPMGTNFFGAFTGSGNLTNGAPLLSALGSYGGLTLTMPPLPGSPAIDGCTNGTVFATDQRGFPRLLDGDGNGSAVADIGAVELAVNYPVVTLPATGITVAGATLNAAVNTNGLDADYYFQYGATTSYGSFTPTNYLPPGSSAVAVNALITGLSPGSTYHFRIVATDGIVTNFGNDLTFAAPLPSTLTVSPDVDQQTFRAYASPFYLPAPTNFTYALTNLGPGVLDWSLNISSNWLSASVTNGTLVSGATTNVDVYINDNNYLLGVETFPNGWIGVLSFVNLTGLSASERHIILQVTPPVNNGGVVLWGASASGAPPFIPGLFRVNLGPANAAANGAAWRAVNGFPETNWLADTTNWYYPSAPARTIEFLPVAGYATPTNQPVIVTPVSPVVITGTYVPLPPILLSDPQQLSAGGFRLTLSSPTGRVYSIQGSTNLVAWSDIQLLTNNTGTNIFTNPPAINSPKGFFRARQLP